MENAQTYLTKVLRSCSSEVEGFLSEKNIERLSRMILKIEKAQVVDDELKYIYRVNGLESFAMTCMWIADRTRKIGIKDDEYEKDRERIARTLSPFIEWDEEPTAPAQQTTAPVQKNQVPPQNTATLEVKLPAPAQSGKRGSTISFTGCSCRIFRIFAVIGDSYPAA